MKKQIFALFFGLVWCSSAQALMLFETENFANPNDKGGNSLWSQQWLNIQFSLDKSYEITDIYGWLSNNLGLLTLAIYSDNNDYPGSLLYEQKISMSEGVGSGWNGISGLSWALDQGDYWANFEVRTAEGDTYDGAMTNVLDPASYEPDSWHLGGWRSPSTNNQWVVVQRATIGLQVLGESLSIDPVPEPTTMILFGTGIAGLVAARRRKKAS